MNRLKATLGIGQSGHKRLDESGDRKPSPEFKHSKRTGGDGKLNPLSNVFAKRRQATSPATQRLTPLAQRLGEDRAVSNVRGSNHHSMVALDDLSETGQLTGGEVQRLEVPENKGLTEAQKDFLKSEQGKHVLQEVNKAGTEVDWAAFSKIPDSLMTPNPRFPNPLFYLAANTGPLKLDPKQHQEAMGAALKCKLFDLSQTDNEGRNPIHVAATHGDVAAMTAFIARDVATHPDEPKKRALNAKANDGRTPLKYAVTGGLKTAPQVTQLLILGGARVSTAAKKQRMVQRAKKVGNDALVEVVVGALGKKQGPASSEASIRKLGENGLLTEAEVSTALALSPQHQAYLLTSGGMTLLWEAKDRGESFDFARYATIDANALPTTAR